MELDGRELALGLTGADVSRLHDELIVLGYTIEADERVSHSFGGTTEMAVRGFQHAHGLPVTGVVDAATAAAFTRTDDMTVQMGGTPGIAAVAGIPGIAAVGGRDPAGGGRRVYGTVYGARGQAAAGARVVLYHKGFGCDDTRLGEAATGEDGGYSITYEVDGPANIQLRGLDARGTEHALSRTLFNAGPEERLNVVAPLDVAPLAPEFSRLHNDLQQHLGREGRLGRAVQDDQCQDITLLARNSGWDGRLVALAATADRLAAQTGIPANAVYAMLRVGLPGDAGELAGLSPSTVDQALRKAAESGVADITDADIKVAHEAAATHAKAWRRANVSVPGALSTVGQLLRDSGLTESEQDTFESLAAQNHGDLWAKAREAGIPRDKIESLQLQGRLAHLTFGNAPLMARLQQDLRTPQELVLKDFHQPEAWQRQLRSLAGNDDELAALIPPAYTGDTTEQRLEVYAEDMARKVRVALPTHVIARRIETGEMPMQAPVVTTLRKAADDFGFRLGSTPTRAFFRDHGEALFANVSPDFVPSIVDGVTTLARVYQITPDDQSMKALLQEGLTSAYQITALDSHTFGQRFAAAIGSEQKASLIHRKAQQVSAVVYNAFAAVSQVASAPAVYAISASPDQLEQSQQNLIKHYPTMEDLFGELDFCECDHCRSVLSPAAYLVDLLRFLDPDKALWSYGNPTPYQKLIERRPDLPELPLTCENTNTALPYIDIVNEILEFKVAGQVLSARDVGEARTEDLIAEPQYLIPEAYDNVLAKQQYPLGLPFHLWLETVRQFLGSLGVPLADILEALRPGDELDPAGPQKYARRAVALERLGVTPQEHALYTDPSDTTWYALYGYANEPAALGELVHAKTLARRLGLSYKDLAVIVRSRFVNPALQNGPLLDKLGVDAEDVRRYLLGGSDPMRMSDVDKAAMKQRLTAAGLDDTALQTLFTADLSKALVLADTQPGCSFDHTVVRHAGGDPATAADFKRINFLARLRKRLGWTLSDLDAALTAFFPSSAASLGQGMRTALLYLAHLDALTHAVNAGRDARVKLLALWQPIDTVHYGQLFLTPGVKAQDAAFDDPRGNYLSAGGVKLADHVTTIQAATGLTAEEVGLILQDNGKTLAAEQLSLDLVSLLYRYQTMAKGLKLSIRELIVLKGLSAVDPFQALTGNPVTTLAQDVPAGTLHFAELAAAVKDSGIRMEELDYLLRDIADPAGPLRPKPDAVPALVRAIATGIGQINGAHSAPADALDYTDAMLAAAAPLALPADVATTFLGMWSGTTPYFASVKVAPNLQLKVGDFAAETALEVKYDPVKTLQWLTYRGVLSDPEYIRLKAAYPDPVFVQLLDLIRPQAALWFEANLTGSVGPFAKADFHPLFDPAPDQTAQRARRKKLVNVFLPYLRGRLTQALVVSTFTADRGADPALVSALVTDTLLLKEQLDAYAAVGIPGITLTYYSTSDGSGAPLKTETVADIDTTGKPVGALSAIAEAFIWVPSTGAYAFTAALGAGVTAQLRFAHLTDPLLTTAQLDNFTELKAGATYHVTVFVSGLAVGHDAAITVRADGLADGPVGRLACSPAATVTRFSASYVVLAKVLRLAEALSFGEGALRQFDWLDLNKVSFADFVRLAEHVRLRRDIGVAGDDLIELLRHTKRKFAMGSDMNAAKAEVFADVCERFGTLTRRPAAVVTAAAGLLGIAAQDSGTIVTVAGMRDEFTLRRLWTVLSQAQTLGVSPAELGRWADPLPDEKVARDLRATLKARYSPQDWLRAAKPVSDALRRLRRDALVSHLLHTMELDRVEQLYEYFLVDPGTEPVVQTSRLRLAISSVQLFIQRCLLNMESPSVLPGSLNTAQWEWMKRYRVWEANRKIFLWPENWCEPEWRDDKTHLFIELEGTLLQGEVSQDLAEDALFVYVSKLEELARLEIVSTWLEEDELDPASNTLHVLGRTHHEPHKYFYRTYHHRMWTPWQPITAQIEGNHAVIAVWRNRPCLFWLSFMDRADMPKKSTITAPAQGATVEVDPNAVQVLDIQLNWAELVSGQWSTGNSSGFGDPITVKSKHGPYDRGSLFINAFVNKGPDVEVVQIVLSSGGDHWNAGIVDGIVAVYQPFKLGDKGGLDTEIHLSLTHNPAFEMAGRNSKARKVTTWNPLSPPFTWTKATATRYQANGALNVWYTKRIEQSNPPVESKASTDVLRQGGNFELVTPPVGVVNASGGKNEIASLARPFFYQDEHYTFYAEPSVTETTFVDWDGWIPVSPAPPSTWDTGVHWGAVQIEQTVPIPRPPEEINPLAMHAITDAAHDSVMGSGMVMPFGSTLIEE